MTVSNGQLANQTTFNTAFVSRTDDTSTIGRLDLNNGVAESGPTIANVQRELNALNSFLGKSTEEAFDVLPTWINTDVGTANDTVKDRAEALTAEFDPATGHEHDGVDAPQVSAPNLANVRLRGYLVKGVNQSAVTGTSKDVSADMVGKVASSGTTVKGVVVTAPYNKVALRERALGAAYNDLITDADGNEVYGRITEAAGVWTLSFYVLVGSTETAHSLTAQDFFWYYQELYNPITDAPVYSEILDIPSDNATEDVIDATATLRGLISAGTQSLGGAKTFTDTTQSTTKDTGAVILEGGLGVEKNINAGGTVTGSNLSGTNTGDVSLAAVGSSPNANGASLSGQALTLQPASASFPGLITAIAQTIAGVKTFVDGIIHQAFFATERADVASAATITALSSGKSFVKLTGSTVTEIQGITAGVNGQRLVIHNGTTVDVTLSDGNTGATAANRLVLADGEDVTLTPGASAELVYDTGQSRWVMASGAGTGGGAAGDTEQTVAGSVSLASGINSKIVTFQTAMPSNSYEVVAQMKNLIDGSPNIEAILTTAQTSAGFTGKWPTNTPTANYIMAFIARHRGEVPLYASDLAVWLDPSDLYTVVEGGGGVSLFRDKSNSNYLFTPFSTGPDMALDYFGAGRHAMQYTAASSHNLKCDVTLPTYITVFMVIDTAGGDSYLMNHNNGASYISTANPGFQIYGGDARWGVTRTGEIQTQGGGITLSGGAKIVTFVYGATEQALYLGNTVTTGALSGSLVSNSNLLADLTLMSASFEDRFLSGHLGEVRIYNRQLTAAEHLAVRQQLSAKWGVAI